MADFAWVKEQLDREGLPYTENEPLCRHTTFRIGGPAALFCMPRSVKQLRCVLRLLRQARMKSYLLGRGSNTLFSDAGFDGAVVTTLFLEDAVRVDGTLITAAAGVPLHTVCTAALEHGLTGLEFACGIPGSLGGAVYMNAGAYDGEMKDVLVSVDFLDEDGETRRLPVQALALGYRTSIFTQRDWCITGASLRLAPGEQPAIREKMEQLLVRRKEKQPLEYPSAGSTFKRPAGAYAGALIEQCGLRGLRVGDAAVSQKHCGFVVNLGHASCADVIALTEQVQRIVKEKTGYTLEREIRVIE